VKVTSQNEYTLIEPIGSGTLSEVYKAIRNDLRGEMTEVVALKIFQSPEKLEEWRREYRSLAQVNSKNCVRVMGFEWIEDKPALCLEFVEGDSLASIVAYHMISKNQLIEIAAQVRNGLEDLWAMGLAHGDLSPRNIMISSSGEIKLLDFGLGNFAGEVKYGTPLFMHPSLASGGQPNRATDTYSLGKVLHWVEAQRVGSEFKIGEVVRGLCSSVEKQQNTTLSQLISSESAVQSLAEIVKKHLQTRRDALEQTAELMVKVSSVPYSGQTLLEQPQVRKKDRPSRRRRLALALSTAIVAIITYFMLWPLRKPVIQKKEATLQVRTQQWKQIWINGESLGYTPIRSHPLQPGRHILKWMGNGTAGELSLTLKSGETKLLTDKDFKAEDE